MLSDFVLISMHYVIHKATTHLCVLMKMEIFQQQLKKTSYILERILNFKTFISLDISRVQG